MKMTIKEKFVKATSDWYDYVGKDHHKDRDCHWYVGRTYSYGCDTGKYKYDTDSWFVMHEGYITEFYENGETEEKVMEKAIKFINDYIKE